MSNRVEDLEEQVAELQAAVNGLTEELVETKERVRQLEDGADADVVRKTQPAAGPESTTAEPTTGNAVEDSGPTERTTKSDVHADVVEREPADATGAAGGVESDAAEADTTEAATAEAAAGTADRADATDEAANDATDGAVDDGDDLLVAGEDEVPPESKPDTTKSEGPEDADDDGESEDSDIIVA